MPAMSLTWEMLRAHLADRGLGPNEHGVLRLEGPHGVRLSVVRPELLGAPAVQLFARVCAQGNAAAEAIAAGASRLPLGGVVLHQGDVFIRHVSALEELSVVRLERLLGALASEAARLRPAAAQSAAEPFTLYAI